MIQKALFLLLLALGVWWLFNDDGLQTYEGCVNALDNHFTEIEDRHQRKSMAKFRCDELVTEGKVQPQKPSFTSNSGQ